jgi:hypothetical protein
MEDLEDSSIKTGGLNRSWRVQEEEKKRLRIKRTRDRTMATLTEIAQNILDSARVLDEYTKSQGLDPTSFTEHTLPTLPRDLEAVRRKLVDSTTELKALAQGPIGQLYDVLFTVCLQIV